MAKYSKLKVICDASCKIPNANVKGRPNFGKAAGAYLFLDEVDNRIESGGFYLGEMSPYEAEYQTLLKTLDLVSGICRGVVEVFMDAEFVIRHMNGTYGLKSDVVKPIFDKIKSIETARFKKVDYYHHSRDTEYGKVVDNLAKQEVNKY